MKNRGNELKRNEKKENKLNKISKTGEKKRNKLENKESRKQAEKRRKPGNMNEMSWKITKLKRKEGENKRKMK